MTGIIDNTKTDERKRWVDLLHSCWMFHQQQIKEMTSPILGAEMTDEQLMHMAWAVSIQDAMALIQQMEAYGYFDEMAEGEEEDLSRPGPAG